MREAQGAASFYPSVLLPQAQMISQYENLESSHNTVRDHEKILDTAFGKLNDHDRRLAEIQSGNELGLKNNRTIC